MHRLTAIVEEKDILAAKELFQSPQSDEQLKNEDDVFKPTETNNTGQITASS